MKFMGEDAKSERLVSKTGAVRAVRTTHAILCGACNKPLDETTNDEYCPESMYWHRRHTFYVLHGRCIE